MTAFLIFLLEDTIDIYQKNNGKFINEGFMALPDGRPLSVIASWKGD